MNIAKYKEMFLKSKCDHCQTQGIIFKGQTVKKVNIFKRKEIFSNTRKYFLGQKLTLYTSLVTSNALYLTRYNYESRFSSNHTLQYLIIYNSNALQLSCDKFETSVKFVLRCKHKKDIGDCFAI